MPDQRYTIIIVPHTRASLRKFQVSSRFLSYALISLAVFFLVCVGTMVHYVKLYREARSLQKYEQENTQLKVSLEQSQLLTQKLNRKLSILTDLSNKLRVMAGLPQSAPYKKQPAKMGIGGVTMMSTINGAPDPQGLASLERRADYLEKNLALLNKYFHQQSKQLAYTPSILPSEGFISSFFGSRRNPFTYAPDFHEGIDVTNEIGTDVVAPADGIVVFTGYKGSYGRVIEIRHDDTVTTLYGHLEKALVKAGEHVKRWQKIGLVGNSGNSTGPHLHYEIHVNDQPVNPLPYILNLDSFSG